MTTQGRRLRRSWRSWGTPAVVVLVASWLIAVPLVVAGTFRAAPKRAPAERPVAQATALPGCTIVGTAAAETLVGTPGDDVICALGGDDVVRGRGGDDVLFGSLGDDSIEGGSGNDRLYGHFGADRLRGGPGRDWLQGGGDADLISGGSGFDIADYAERIRPVRVTLGRGENDGAVDEGDDVRRSVEGARGGRAGDTLIGNARRNRLAGRGGDDALKGGRGNDRMRGGAGLDRLDGRDAARFVDRLRCGPGQPDTALADARDVVASSCESAQQPPTPGAGRNRPPTDILIADNSVPEDQPAGTVVGTLDAADADAGDSHTFALVNGAGDADNAAFAIVGDQLRSAAVFDFEVKSSYTIRVRVRDERGAAFQKALAISVTNVQENRAPTDITLAPASVAELMPAGTSAGTLAATDADAGDTHSYALVAGAGGADNAAFATSGNQLNTAQVFDYEVKSSYSIRVRVTDSGSPALSFEKVFTVTVTDANDAPTAGDKTVTGITEDDGATAIGLSGSDANGEALTFLVVSGPQHGDLDTNTPAATCGAGTPSSCTASVDYTLDGDFNGADSFTYTVNDGTSDSAPATVSITVDPVNDAPVAYRRGQRRPMKTRR